MSTTIRMVFQNSTGKDISLSYNYADPSVEGSSVKSVMEAIIDHGDVFADAPVSIVGAELITRVTTDVDLS